MQTKLSGIIVAIGIFGTCLASPANAATIVWTLEDFAFGDGGTVSGSFSTDSTTGLVTSFDITTSHPDYGGFGFVYDSSMHTDTLNPTTYGFQIIDDSIPSVYLQLSFKLPFTTPSTDYLITYDSYEEAGEYGQIDIGSGDATGVFTPLPAALPLFATGLGVMGLLGRRRKRKSQAVA